VAVALLTLSRRVPPTRPPPRRKAYNKALAKGKQPAPLPEELKLWEEKRGVEALDLGEVILK
jgi:hypothetical protein